MIEQFLQTALAFIKEVWFQLDSRFDLENTEVLKFLKPYLIKLQDDPLYMGVSLAALFLVPYALIKVRSISKERERKLDELMEEMEDDEEYDEDDPRRLRRSEPEAEEDKEKPLFENDNDAPPSYMKVLDRMEGKDVDEEDFESELEEFELDSSSSDNEESINSEESAEPISSQLTESNFEKDLNEFMSDDIDMKKDVELHLDDSTHDQAIKELQDDGELMEFDGHLPSNDPFANYSELDEDGQDKAIKDLQDEMERTINQLTEQIEEPTEPPSSIKDLSHLRIGGDATIDDEYSPEEDEEEFFLEDPPSPETGSSDIENEAPALLEESTPISELSDSEILAALEPELEDTLDLESMLEPESEPEFQIESEKEPEAVFEPEARLETEPELESIPDTRDYEPELAGFTFEAESDISSEEPKSEIDDLRLEPEVSAENFTFAAESTGLEEIPEPELRAERPPVTEEYASPGQTDSLIDRLKFLQNRFENRYQPVERSPSPLSPVEKNIPNYTSENFVEPRRYSSTPAGLPPGSKKYMDLLESFIFMKDQKKHK